MLELLLIAFIIAVALAFDVGNGMNDAANSISTVVATGVLTLRQAALMAAAFNFIGPFVFGVSVATTIAKGIVVQELVSEFVILGGLVGAILWVYLATYWGVPVSASHSLIGGLLGSAIMASGLKAVIFPGRLLDTLLFIFLAPLIGLLLGFFIQAGLLWVFRRQSPSRINRYFRRLQLLSVAAYSMGHGTNDAQKVMGIISLLLFSAGMLGPQFYVPAWVIFASATAICVGTFIGGYRVVHTLGIRTTKLRPINGFCAETAGASLLFATSHFGIPVSTTHTITGSIMGVGVTRRVSAVRWTIARRIFYSWILTIPIAMAAGGLAYLAVSAFG